MSDDTDKDIVPVTGLGFSFSEDEKEALVELAALGNTPEEIAVFLEVDVERFVSIANNRTSELFRLIVGSRMQAKHEVNSATLTSAKGGNATQTQRLDKVQYAMHFEREKRRIFYGG